MEEEKQNFEDILHIPKEPRPEHPVPLPELNRLAFDGVSFKHQSATSPALTDISLPVTLSVTRNRRLTPSTGSLACGNLCKVGYTRSKRSFPGLFIIRLRSRDIALAHRNWIP